MRSRRVAAALAVALLLGGCGVARETEVIRDKPGPQRGFGSDTEDRAEANGRQATTDPTRFVTNFLRAAAGDYKSAADRVRKFLAPGIADNFKPASADPLVVQLRDLRQSPRVTGTGTTVSVKLGPVGRLNDQGAIVPLDADDPKLIERDFVVVPDNENPQNGMFLNNADMSDIYLLTTAFTPPVGGTTPDNDVLYRTHLLYFWDLDAGTLVPDLRYLPRTLTRQQRPTEVVRRLLVGPSGLLKNAVQELPQGTDLRGNVVLENNTLVVDVNAKATSVPDGQLITQLRWSLWDQHEGPITLLMEGQQLASDPPTRLAGANPVTSLSASPTLFCVANFVVLSECKDPAQQAPPEILAVKDNTGVQSAAIALRTDATYSALVVSRRSNPPGQLSLLVGKAPPDGKATYKATNLSGSIVSRPVWLDTVTQPGGLGLVAIDGALRVFDFDAKPVDQGRLNVPGNVTAVAAAPDARRIAYIVGGQVYVAALIVHPDETPVVANPRRLVTSLPELTGVAWSRPDRLVVAGSGELLELTVDGAVEEHFWAETGQSAVKQLVANPDNPSNGSSPGRVLVELDTQSSFEVFATSLDALKKTGTPTPSPAPTSAPPQVKVTAPFFQE